MNFVPLKVSQAVWRGCLLSHSRSIWKHWHLVTVRSEMTIEKSWRAGGVSMPLQGLQILKRLLHLLPFFICLLQHSPFGGPAAASVSRFTWPLEVFKPWVCVHLAADSHCYPSNKSLISKSCQSACSPDVGTAPAPSPAIYSLSCSLQTPSHPVMTPRALWAHPALPHTPTGAVKVTNPLPKCSMKNGSSPTPTKHFVSQKTGFSFCKTTVRKPLADSARSGAEVGQGCGVCCCTLAQIVITPLRDNWVAALQTREKCQRCHTKSLVWTKPSDSPRFHPVFRSLI